MDVQPDRHRSFPDGRLWFACLCLLAGVLLMPVRLCAQENYEIRKIKFSGNKTLSSSALLDHMGFQPSNIIQRKLLKKDPSLYSGELMKVDLERLTRFYQSQGFLHADVVLDSLVVDPKKQTVGIYIAVTENEPVRVDSVAINITDSMENVPRKDRFYRYMYKRLELKRGSRFVDDALYGDMKQMNTIFSNYSYVYSETSFKLGLVPEQNRVNIDYELVPGRICHFGETSISGNTYVKEKYIRKQLNYKAGDTYNLKLVDDTRQQLYDLQLFRVVSILSQTNRTTQSDPIPMRIQIEELPRWMSKFGVGWGTEDHFRAFADVTYRGVFGGTSRLNLYAKHSALEPYNLSLSWIEPQFFAQKLSLTVNPYIRREREPAYDVQRFGLNVPFGYAFGKHIKTSLAYYVERVKQFNAQQESRESGYFDPFSKEFLYNKSGLSASFSYSTAEPSVSPVQGTTITVGGKLNGYIFGGDFNYSKFWVDARKYMQVKRLVIAGRAMIGGIHSSDDHGFIPMEERFYSGGSDSNRGWARSTLGPELTIEEDGVSKVIPAGGKSVLELNLELRHPLVWRIELAAFLDVGNVWKNSFDYRFDQISYTAGGGLRVNTPIGPVRLDIGYPFAGPGQRQVQAFLSVGQAF